MNFETEFFNRFELLISSIGIVLGFFFGIILSTKTNKNSKANLFLAIYLLTFSLRTGKALFHNYYAINDRILTLFLGLFLLIGPSLWFYVKLLYTSNNSLKKINYFLHYAPFVLVTFFSLFISNDSIANLRAFYFILFLHGLIYCFYTFYWLLTNPSFHEISQKNIKIKKWLIAFILATTLMFIHAILIFFDILSFYPSSTYLFSFIIVSLAILGNNNLWIFDVEKKKYTNSTLDDKKASEYSKQLKQFMEIDKLFLDPELTLVKLADRMNISSKQLSQIINQIENTNYSQYIAKYRIEQAKKKLTNPNYHNYKIAAIAFESGFNSISSFNITFKNLTNTTPLEYRESYSKKT
ncbi:AraC family transcriptional regulator [Flavobacterium sp.]|uniref:helix-turn-helix domain-containing protein n=1 Tax=Flavobacterium sp. TaxID=239 RepID=UPI002611077D|nr:AraC family transcriptional regulator [Flavobacterium sp.]